MTGARRTRLRSLLKFNPRYFAAASNSADAVRVFPINHHPLPMKTDRFSFPLVALVILAGVILAFVDPSHPVHAKDTTTAASARVN